MKCWQRVQGLVLGRCHELFLLVCRLSEQLAMTLARMLCYPRRAEATSLLAPSTTGLHPMPTVQDMQRRCQQAWARTHCSIGTIVEHDGQEEACEEGSRTFLLASSSSNFANLFTWDRPSSTDFVQRDYNWVRHLRHILRIRIIVKNGIAQLLVQTQKKLCYITELTRSCCELGDYVEEYSATDPRDASRLLDQVASVVTSDVNDLREFILSILCSTNISRHFTVETQ